MTAPAAPDLSLDPFDIVDHLLSGGRTWQMDFWARPLTLREFCASKEHLKNVKLSDRQIDTLESFLGTDPVAIFDKQSPRKNVCILAWGKGCLVGSHQLTLPDGTRRRLDDLAGEGEMSVLAYDPDVKSLKSAISSRPFWRGNGPCVRVRTATGRVIECFLEHLFYVGSREAYKRRQGRGAAWVPVREMAEGDFIALPRYAPSGGNLHEPEVARWVGMILGNGAASATDALPRLKMPTFAAVLEDVRQTVTAVTGRAPSETVDRSCVWFGSGFDVWGARRGGNPLYAVADEYGLLGKNAHTKRVPEQCFTYDVETTWELLSGLWLTDGWVCPVVKSRGAGHWTWEAGYCSVSEGLVRDIAELLHRQGIIARVGKKHSTYRGQPHISWTLKLRDRAMLCEFLRRVRLTGPKGARVQQALNELGTLPAVSPFVDDVFWDRVVEIAPIGNHDYYDLEVEDLENYVADGVLHHNSGKNMTTTIIQQYLLYVLLCMRDPLGYFGFPQGESIDMLNVASSAAQAQKNFFNKFTRRLKAWVWLKEHFMIIQHGKPVSNPETPRATIRITDDAIITDIGVQCISAHSDSKGYEGYSPIFWVMDEASSWETEYIQGENGEQIAVSRAHSIFDTLRTSSISRSWKWAGMIISYPRNEDDFTLDMAQAAMRGDLPDAMGDIAATWEVKPTHMWVHQETFTHTVVRPWGTFEIHPPKDFEEEFRQHPTQSELKYACIPSRTNTYFIYQSQKIYDCASDVIRPIVALKPIEFLVPMGDEGTVSNTKYIGYTIDKFCEPILHSGDYYVHIDLSLNSCATTMVIGHAEPYSAQIMVQDEGGERLESLTHMAVIDQIICWHPDQAHLVSTVNVDEILDQLDKRLYFRYVSSDQYQSSYTLEKSNRKGREAGQHTVKNPEYLLLRSLIHAGAIRYPNNPKLILELEKLVWDGKRVQHLAHYSKDIADGVAGVARSIFLKRGKRRQRVKFAFMS